MRSMRHLAPNGQHSDGSRPMAQARAFLSEAEAESAACAAECTALARIAHALAREAAGAAEEADTSALAEDDDANEERAAVLHAALVARFPHGARPEQARHDTARLLNVQSQRTTAQLRVDASPERAASSAP